MAPRKDVGLSLYEMLFGLPYLGRSSELSTMEMRDQFLKNYTLTSSMTLLFLRLKSHLPQIPHLEFNVHSYRPGDYILIRTCKKERLQPT
jgi:hypothetical protein